MAKRKRRPSQPLDLSIVIPAYGPSHLLWDCLNSIKSTCEGVHYKVVVVDDNKAVDTDSSEQIRKVVDDFNDSKIILVRNGDNYGFAKSCNTGASKVSQSRYILFLNSDVVVNPTSISTAISTMDTDTKIGVLGFRLLFPTGTQSGPAETIQHYGIGFDINGAPRHLNIGWPDDHHLLRNGRDLQAVTGAAMVVRRSVWDEIPNFYAQYDDKSGGFNEVYSKGTYEDIELCLIVKNVLGNKVVVIPGVSGYHYVGSSVRGDEGGGFPIQRNHSIFTNRCKGLFYYDEFLYY